MTVARAASPSDRFVLTHRVAFMLIERGGRHDPADPTGLAERSACCRARPLEVTLQDLRHYVATTSFDAGVAYRTVADPLGSSEVTLRLHYDGRTDTGKRDAVKASRRRPG
jgi:hypothetical protein